MKEFKPLISVIIPVYNGEDYLEQAINSVLKQSYSNIEIIVVNDGSTDSTEEICQKFGGKIKYISKKNGGISSAINNGIKKMKGEYYSWLSHDDLYKSNKIEIQVETLKKLRDKKTVLFSNVDFIDEKSNIIYTSNYLEEIGDFNITNGIYPVIRGAVNGNTILIHKQIFEDVGLFDEALRTSSDYDMWLKIFEKYNTFFINESLIQYRLHANQDTKKSPLYNPESDFLWSNIINSLTLKQIKNWNLSPFSVYIDLYTRMKLSNFKKASFLSYNKAKEHFEKCSKKVSIIMPAYNEEKYIKKAIESLISQTYGDFEIIVVDDGSTDKTFDIVKNMIKNDFRIRLFSNKYEKGVSGALNTGIELSNSEYITRLDSDDTCHFMRIEEQVKILEKDKTLCFCATNINFMDKYDNIIKFNAYKEPKAPLEFELLFTNPIPNATLMYRKSIIDNENLIFENFKVAEDLKFFSEIVKSYKGKFINLSLYNYRILKNSLFHSNSKMVKEVSEKIILDFYSKNFNKELPKKFIKLTNYDFDKNYLEKLGYLNYYKIVIKIIEDYRKKFNWTDNQYYDAINFLLENLLLNFKNIESTQLSFENISLLKTIGGKINYYYKTYGFKKTIIWLLIYPYKRILRK